MKSAVIGALAVIVIAETALLMFVWLTYFA